MSLYKKDDIVWGYKHLIKMSLNFQADPIPMKIYKQQLMKLTQAKSTL